VKNNDELIIYPNPAHDEVSIQFNNPVNKTYHANIMDLSGKTLRRFENISDNRTTLNLSGLPSGMYIIELHGESTHRSKIILR